MIPIDEQPYPLPVGWQWVTLDSVAEIIMGQSPSGDATTDDANYTPLIGGAADMGDDCPSITRYTKKPTKLSEKDDVIICVRATLGKPIFSDGEYCLGRGVAALRPRTVSKDFLRYGLINFEQYLYDNANGTTFLQIASNQLKQIPFPLPPLDEQQRIVSLLDEVFADLDEAKERLQGVLRAFELFDGKIYQRAFEGGLTGLWRAENGMSLDSWQRCLLGDVCQINPPKISTRDLSDDLEVSFVPMVAVSDVRGEITAPQRKPLREVKSGFTNFAEGDVLFAKITPCMENGKAALVGELINHIGYGSTEFFVLRCGKKIFNRFVYHLVRWQIFRNEAKSVMAGAVGQQRVPKRFLTSYQLNLPPPAEQKEIVRLLDDLLGREQRTKDHALKTVERVELMKKSILARAFRGELGTN